MALQATSRLIENIGRSVYKSPSLWLSGLGFTAAAVGASSFLSHIGYPYRLFHNVVKDSPNHGGYLVAQVLKAHGVKFVFSLIGGHISPIIVGCEKVGIRVVDTRHEVTTVFAADAVARLSGTIGVAAVTAGPGVTNTVTALKNAQMAESPVLLLGGAAANLLKGRGALQDIEQLSLMRTVCKYVVSVKHVREIVPALRKAIHVAMSGTPGPVFVELPIDTVYDYANVRDGLGIKEMSSRSKGLMKAFSVWYLNQYLDNLFSGAWEQRQVTPIPPKVQLPTSSQVRNVADLLVKAKHPVLLLSSQATLPPFGIDKISHAVQNLRVPCYMGGMARGLLGGGAGSGESGQEPIQFFHNRKEALKEADLIILAGIPVDFRLSYGRNFNKNAKIITINRDVEKILMNADFVWHPTLTVLGDVGTFLVMLNAEMQKRSEGQSKSGKPAIASQWTDWVATLKKREQARDAEIEKQANDRPEKHLNTLRLLSLLNKNLPSKSILIADGGDFVGAAAYTLRPRVPLGWLDPGPFGTLGCAAGFALGAKLCRPDHEVFIIFGDGSLGYSLMEFDSFVRHKIPLVAVVGNDACWTQILRDQKRIFDTTAGCMLAYTNYEKAVEGLGARGLVVDSLPAETEEIKQIEEKIKAARELANGGAPVLLNCLIGRSSFREGSISV